VHAHAPVSAGAHKPGTQRVPRHALHVMPVAQQPLLQQQTASRCSTHRAASAPCEALLGCVADQKRGVKHR
jgi:hypothetical protein